MSKFKFYLLRGLGRETAHWGPFFKILQESPCALDVRGIDLPGSGRFRGLTAPLSIEENALFVESQIPEQESPNNKRVLVAISLGGMVAWEMARAARVKFDRIFLINTSLASVSPVHHRLQWQAWRHLLDIAKERELVQRELAILKMVSRNALVWDELAADFAHIAMERPMPPLHIVRQLIAASRYKGGEPAPGSPLVLINSLGDDMVDPRCSEAIAAQWSLPLITHPQAGHDISIDDPDWLVKTLCDHLQSYP